MRLRPHPSRRTRARRRAAALGLALLVTCGSLALAPTAVADDEGGDEGSEESSEPGAAEAPFGEQIEPGTNFQDTATVETGTYALSVPEVGEDHYFEIERTEPGEVIWYGVTALLAEAPGDANLRLIATAEGDESRLCGEERSPSEPLTFRTSLYNSNRSGECRDAESITLQVSNVEGLLDGSIPGGEDSYQLTVWQEPAVENRDELPGANEVSPWVGVDLGDAEPEPIEGATSFTEAENLGDGVYETTVRQGRAGIFAFPLTFGQHAQVEAEIVEGADTFESLEPVWITPLGGQVRSVNPAGGPGPDLSIDGEDGVAGWSTPTIGYLNRERIGLIGSDGGTGTGGSAATPATFAGTYFLLLELPSATEFNEFPEKVTIRMRAATVDDYEGQSPDYTSEPAPLSALDGSGFVETAEEEQAAREAEAEPAPWPLVAGLFAGAALLAVVGGVAVGRALRSGA